MSAHHVYIGLGTELGVFPSNPLGVASVIHDGMVSLSRVHHRIEMARSLLSDDSWASVNADAAFWNCYVMDDSSPSACPAGVLNFSDPRPLSQSLTYFNHGSLDPNIIWALDLPMSPLEQKMRIASVHRFDSSLSASLLGPSVVYNSAEAFRERYPDGPPQPLPGYYRKDHLHWAKLS